MDQRSVFFDEWMRSLREQYKYVVRSDDRVTLPTLTAVMQNVGFGEEELARLRVEATMHVDDVDADYVADMDVLEASGCSHAHGAESAAIDQRHGDQAEALPKADPEEDSDEALRIFPVPELPMEDDDERVLTFEDSLSAERDDSDEAPQLDEHDDAADDSAGQMSLF